MARYIDADKLKERIKASCAFPNMGTDGYFLRGCVLDLIEQQPTADVAEVVRCEKCVYCGYNSSSETYHCRRRGYFSEMVQTDDFCSYGKESADD